MRLVFYKNVQNMVFEVHHVAMFEVVNVGEIVPQKCMMPKISKCAPSKSSAGKFCVFCHVVGG